MWNKIIVVWHWRLSFSIALVTIKHYAFRLHSFFMIIFCFFFCYGISPSNDSIIFFANEIAMLNYFSHLLVSNLLGNSRHCLLRIEYWKCWTNKSWKMYHIVFAFNLGEWKHGKKLELLTSSYNIVLNQIISRIRILQKKKKMLGNRF